MKLNFKNRNKCLLMLLLAGLSLSETEAQITTSTPWIWMHGDNSGNAGAVYGTQGVPDPANQPGASNTSVTWSTPDGSLWLFGGYGNTVSGNGRLNSLWKYTPSTNEWVWVKGDNATNMRGVYGPIGTPSATNKPGARSSAATWTDSAGNLWMFGGFGYTGSSGANMLLNDLWKYEPASNQWTWVKGDSSANPYGVYGTKGVAAATNKPGGREYPVCWTDSAGKFWMFGGRGLAVAGAEGYLNDLWKYDPLTNEWTWVSGDNAVDVPGSYGTIGTPSATNKPGGRYRSSGWTDTAGNFWIFGGHFVTVSTDYYFNDLWKYDLQRNLWTWMKGANVTNATGVYGTKGTSSNLNTPGARSAAAEWRDQDGNFWLLGGHGFPASGGSGFLNDFWKYDPVINEWTWVKGENTIETFGIYGTRGVESAGNMPGSRGVAAYWTDSRGEFWLFGGDGFPFDGRGEALLGDLWKLKYCVALAQPESIEGNAGTCAYLEQTYSVPAVKYAASYTWTLPAGWAGSSTGSTITVIPDANSGTITVVANGLCDTSAAEIFEVEVYPVPEAVINVDGFNLSTTSSFSSYQWFLDGKRIEGATDSVYAVTANGGYSVAVIDKNGCKDTSDVYDVTNYTNSLEEVAAFGNSIKIFPNPAQDFVNIQSPIPVRAIVTNIEGKVLLRTEKPAQIDMTSLSEGVYLLRITDVNNNLLKVEKLVKLK